MDPSVAYTEGLHAQAQGEGRNACPYAEGSSEREDWLKGWDAAAELDDHADAAGDA